MAQGVELKNHRISTGAEFENQGTVVGILNVEQLGGVFLELLEWKRDLKLGISDFITMGSAFICGYTKRKVEFYSIAPNIFSACIQIHSFNTS